MRSSRSLWLIFVPSFALVLALNVVVVVVVVVVVGHLDRFVSKTKSTRSSLMRDWIDRRNQNPQNLEWEGETKFVQKFDQIFGISSPLLRNETV